MQGDTAEAFGGCVAAMEAAIRAHPAEWDFWFEPDDPARIEHAGRTGGLQESAR